MKHLAWLICVLLVAVTASAQESSVPLVLEVRAQRISQSELEAALRKELNKGKAEAAPEGQLSLSEEPSNVVRLTYRDARGHETTRDLYLPPNDPELLEKVTIAAANLVRDQAAALLAELEAQRLAEEAAQPKPPQAPPAPPAPAAAPPAKPKPPAYDPCKPPETTVFGFDLVPFVGSSSTPQGRNTARRISLGWGGTISAGVHGFEFATGINIDRKGSCGLQLAGGVNTTFGPVRGAQLATVNFAWGSLHGLQGSVLNVATGDAEGAAQLGVVNVLGGRMRGVQLGVVNVAGGGVQGAQLGVANVAVGPTPAQLGVANIAVGDNKLQAGVLNVVAKGDSRTQLGVLNVTSGSVPAQLGVVNVAGLDTRVQIGALNVARRAKAPVGVLSIVTDGHTSADAWVTENGTLLAGFTHGGDMVRNTFAAGTRFGKHGPHTVLALGISARLWTDTRFNIDFGAMHELLTQFSPFKTRTQTERLKLDATIWLHERVGLLASAGYALMITQDEEVKSQAWFGETKYQTAREGANGNRAGLYGFPTINLGVRVMLSSPKKPGR